MTFPAGLTLVTVTCTFDALPDGGASGTVQIFYDGPLTGGADNSIVPFVDVTGVLVAGTCDLVVPATNDPGWIPQDFAYTVRATVGGRTKPGTLQLDYQTTAVNLADVVTWDGSTTPGTSYIPLSQKGAYGGVAALDADTGEVLDGDGNAISGGGGGTASGTVVSETSFGQSSAAGAAAAYSRGDHTHGTPAAPTAASVGADPAGTAASAVAAHSADTTSVHGITDTSALVLTGDSRLSDARTPTAHATSHQDGGSDELALDGSQITGGTVAVGRLPTGTSSGTVALGDAPAAAVTTHVGLSDPHTQYLMESVATTKGDLLAATASATIARLGVGSDGQVLTADSGETTGLAWADASGGGGTAPTFARAIVTSGDITVSADAGWTLLTGGPTLSLAAAAGDDIEGWLACLIDRNSGRSDFFELVVVVSGAIARFASTGTNSPTTAGEGDPAMYTDSSGDRYAGITVPISFSAVSGDIDGGNVVLAIAHKGGGGGKVYASTGYPLRWHIRNDH